MILVCVSDFLGMSQHTIFVMEIDGKSVCLFYKIKVADEVQSEFLKLLFMSSSSLFLTFRFNKDNKNGF